MSESPLYKSNSFFFPFLPQSEYDKIKTHKFFHVICHIVKQQYPELFNFFDFAMNTNKELLAAKLEMANSLNRKLKIIKKENKIINQFFKGKDALRLFTCRLFLSVLEFDVKMNSEVSTISAFKMMMDDDEKKILDLGEDLLSTLNSFKSEFRNTKEIDIESKIQFLDTFIKKLRETKSILPGLEGISVPSIENIQKIYYLVLFLGSKQIWYEHLQQLTNSLNGIEDYSSSNDDKSEKRNSKKNPLKLKKKLAEEVCTKLKDYFSETELKQFKNLLDGTSATQKIEFKASGKILGYVFRQLQEKRKIKRTKKDIGAWIMDSFTYFNSQTKSFSHFTEDYIHQIMYHSAGIPSKKNRVDISDLLT